jgi:hypothetical protein
MNLLRTIACVFISVSLGYAIPPSSIEKVKFQPVDARQASWVFSGMVTNETGEAYGYYFQLERDDTHFHAKAALIDEASKVVLFEEDSHAVIESAAPYDWHVGRSFLQFNPINDSWIFGVKSKTRGGFNFKVDMLKQFEGAQTFHHLRPGVTMMVSRTSELNGHVSIGNPPTEQFVTTNNVWFRQIWQEQEEGAAHQSVSLTSVLCQFVDGSRFYAVNLHEPDAQSGAIAGWYNADGLRKTMSQFIQVSQSKEGQWHIHSQAPHLDLILPSMPEQTPVIAGFVQGAKSTGFCMLNQPETDHA